MITRNEKGPAPEQASEATQQRSGMDRPFTEVVPAAEVIVDARAGDGNETSSKVAPRYTEWHHLVEQGQWTAGVPDWARDHDGRMNDVTAMRAVIDELAAIALRSPARTVAAWMRADDPSDCISDAKKCSMIEHNGLPGKRAAEKYSIALGVLAQAPAPAPADERAAFEIVGATAALRECVDAAEAWRIISDAEDADDIDPVERTMAASRRVAAFDAARKLLADRVSSTDETVPKWVFNALVNTLQPAWDYIQTHQEQFNARAGDNKNAILVEFFLRAASANETGAEGAPRYAEWRHPRAQATDSAWRELCHRLYVELFHCDQQMRSTRDEDGEPHWTQSSVVRDVLADAKAALEGPPAQAGALVGMVGVLRRAREELSIVEWENDPPRRVVELLDEIGAFLQGANHAE